MFLTTTVSWCDQCSLWGMNWGSLASCWLCLYLQVFLPRVVGRCAYQIGSWLAGRLVLLVQSEFGGGQDFWIYFGSCSAVQSAYSLLDSRRSCWQFLLFPNWDVLCLNLRLSSRVPVNRSRWDYSRRWVRGSAVSIGRSCALSEFLCVVHRCDA